MFQPAGDRRGPLNGGFNRRAEAHPAVGACFPCRNLPAGTELNLL